MSFREILPAGVSVAEGSPDGWQAGLHPSEQTLVGRAVPKRRREFAAGRACARAALARLGLGAVAILAGPRREPLWPGGVVGSITHTDSYCGAAVARSDDFAAVGIDAEPNAPLGEELARLVCTDAERRWCRARSGGAGVCRDKLLFSIKECVFKAVYPLLGADPGFLNVEVSVALDARRFRVVPVAVGEGGDTGGLLRDLRGAFALDAGHLLAAAWISKVSLS